MSRVKFPKSQLLMSQSVYLACILCVAAYMLLAADALHESMNFVVPPLKRKCFYQDLVKDSPSHKVEAFIISGGSTDILLTFHGPLIESDIISELFEDPIFRESIDAYTEAASDTLTYTTDFKPGKPGTYAICLDNRNSRFSSKSVQLDVRSSNSPDSPVITIQDSEPDEVDPGRLKESLKSLGDIYKGIVQIQTQQQRDRHRLILHSETNKSNYSKVFQGSIFETFVFITVSIFQIYFVRRWFASRTSGAGQSTSNRVAKEWA